jgi:adenylylsulfate kinase-like enzyme
MTGIQDPYEEPLSPDVVINTEVGSQDKSANEIIAALEKLGHLKSLSSE